MKMIIVFMIILTVLDIMISVIGLKTFPVTSIIINGAIILLLMKYSKQSKTKSSNEDKTSINDLVSSNLGLKEIMIYLFIPFVIFAVVCIYVVYLFI